MSLLKPYLRPYFPSMCLQFFIKFAGTITDLLLPWLLSHILDEIVPRKNARDVYVYGGLMLLCSFSALLLNITANRMALKTSRGVTEALRHDLFEKISYLSACRTDEFTTPSLISRLTSDTYNVHHMVDRMQRLGIRAPILLLGGIIITLSLEPLLTLVLVGILPLLAIVVVTVSRKGVRLYKKSQQALDVMVRKVQETMTGIRVIRALSKTEYETARFDEVNTEVVKRDQSAGVLMALTNPVIHLLLNAGLTLVVVAGAYLVNAGLSQTGKIIAFLSYFTIILNALLMVTRLFVLYSKGSASAGRIAEVLNAPEDMAVLPAETPPAPRAPHIEFRNVSFSYNKVQKNLRNLSFSLRHGETLGILGATGSGKSTVLSLLLRFYDPDEGQIFIDGRDIRSLPAEELRTRFGVVFQNDFLFADTIRENIDFGRNLSDGQIESAACAAQAGFIKGKAGGFAHPLSIKGANLSGGQKQRLLISRALAANPEILLLDDASSALDYLTDAALRKALARAYGQTTCLIVAQRVSSLMHASHILMLEEGRVIGSGTHGELLAACASYREICETQMEAVTDDESAFI